jgi:hypothetical protein
MITIENINTIKRWVRDEMKPNMWIEVNERQVKVFKTLIVEWYGWPDFTINFNRDMNKVMKVEL